MQDIDVMNMCKCGMRWYMLGRRLAENELRVSIQSEEKEHIQL